MVANEWLDEQHAEDQRKFQQLLMGSFAAHLVAFAVLAFAPSPDAPPLPEVIRVNLVAGLPAPPAARRPPSKAPAPLPVAKPQPAPAPKPVPKQVVLPKQAPKAVPKKRVVPAARPKPVDYDDAMAQLRNEMGETAPSQAEPVEDVTDAELMATTAGAESGAGASIDEATARWVLATQRHLRGRYVTLPEFSNRGLATFVEVELTTGGDVVGTPSVRRSSGDPFFDDNAVRAVMAGTPLPAPPSAGRWTFSFTGE